LRYSAKGSPVARFTVVTSRRVKDQQTGEWSDADTSFWDVVAFSQLAENICESLAKGTAVLVTGRAAQEEWETKDGQKRRSIKVTADEVAPSMPRQPRGLPLTPETTAAPGTGKSGQAQACPRATRGTQTPAVAGHRTPPKQLNWRSIVRSSGKITNLGWCQGSSEADPSRIK